MMEFQYLVLYDDSCGLCHRTVQWILKHDTKKQFCFSSLEGKTAQKWKRALPSGLKQGDSVILIENFRTPSFQVHLFSQAAFRIAWLMGMPWSLYGFLYFFPPSLFNWLYRWIALNRHRFFRSCRCEILTKEMQLRFLP